MYEIIMAKEAWARFWNYVELCPWEVAAFGYCTTGDGHLYVDTLFPVPQEVCGTEVDFTDKALPYAIDKAVKDERLNDLRFCIHSHVNMTTGFSTTDDDMIEKIGRTGTPWFASAIFNKRHDTNARVDLFSGSVDLPGMKQVTVEAGIYREQEEGESEFREQCLQELDEYVTKQTNQWVNKQDKNKGKKVTNGKVHDIKALPPAREWEAPADGYMPNTDAELIEEAIKNGWQECEDQNGFSYFFDGNGAYRGSIGPDSPYSAAGWDDEYWQSAAGAGGTP